MEFKIIGLNECDLNETCKPDLQAAFDFAKTEIKKFTKENSFDEYPSYSIGYSPDNNEYIFRVKIVFKGNLVQFSLIKVYPVY